MEPKHTPTPWNLGASTENEKWVSDSNGHDLCALEKIEDAAFIVRAVNAYEPILEILKQMASISYFDEAEGPELRAQNGTLHRLAKQAIAQAEGKC